MEPLIIEKEGPLAWLTFNNPQRRNAVTYGMWQGLPPALEDFAKDDSIRVILLKGAGEEAFVAGADISEFKELRHNSQSAEKYNQATHEAFRALRYSAKPVIAMVRGFCIGGGCAIALNCDLRIASEDAKFAIPAAKLGIAFGSENVQQVVQVVGPAYAREMIYTARTYHAHEALRMGLIHQCVPNEALVEFTRQYALAMAENAPLTIHSVKIAIDEALKPPTLRDEARVEEAMRECFDSQDYQEGYQAFLEKRKPHFHGR